MHITLPVNRFYYDILNFCLITAFSRASVIEFRVECVEILAVKTILYDPQTFAKSLVMHNFTFPKSGVMQGETAAEYIKNHPEVDKNQDGKIQYVLLEGEAGHQDAISRTDYSVRTVLDAGISLEKLSYQFADWNRGQAENRMNRLISQYGEGIELILSNNDEMALGAVEAYRKAGYEPSQRPVIFGIDGLDDALEAIKDGEMQGTVYNDKEDQALQIAKLAYEVFKGEQQVRKELKEGRYYVSQYQQVDSSNVEEFLDR